jgi:hypothetical protein
VPNTISLIAKTLGLAFTVLLGILGPAAPPPVRAPGPHGSSSPRRVATRWVDAVDEGNARAACELQTVAEVAGKDCELLPVTGVVYYCPETEIGPLPKRRHLTPVQQVKRVVARGGHGRAVIVSEVQPDEFRGVLGLARRSGRWQVASFEYHGHLLRPAGLIFEGGSSIPNRISPACQ